MTVIQVLVQSEAYLKETEKQDNFMIDYIVDWFSTKKIMCLKMMYRKIAFDSHAEKFDKARNWLQVNKPV